MGKLLEEVVLDRRKMIQTSLGILGLSLIRGSCGVMPDPRITMPGVLEPIVNNETNPGIRVALGVREGLWRVGEGWDVEMNYRQFEGIAGKTAKTKTTAQGVAYFEIPLNSEVSKQARFKFNISRNPDGNKPFPECAFWESEDLYDSTRLKSPEYVVDVGFDMISGIKASDQQCFECQLFPDKLKWASCIEPRVVEKVFPFCNDEPTPTPQPSIVTLNAIQSAFTSLAEPDMVSSVKYPGILRVGGYSRGYGYCGTRIQFPDLSSYKTRRLKNAQIILTVNNNPSEQEETLRAGIGAITTPWKYNELNNLTPLSGCNIDEVPCTPSYCDSYLSDHFESSPNSTNIWGLTGLKITGNCETRDLLEVLIEDKIIKGFSIWPGNWGFGAGYETTHQLRTYYAHNTSHPPQLRLEFED